MSTRLTFKPAWEAVQHPESRSARYGRSGLNSPAILLRSLARVIASWAAGASCPVGKRSRRESKVLDYGLKPQESRAA